MSASERLRRFGFPLSEEQILLADQTASFARERLAPGAKARDQRLKEEAPFAYKPITPVVQTVEEAGVARRVARLFPIVTVKG